MGEEDEAASAEEGTVAPPPPTAPPAVPPVKTEEWETRFKYLFADFENFRRRAERERESLTRQTRAALLRELLPLVEAFRSAHASSGHLPSDDPLRRGIELLDLEWSKFLKHQGLEPVAEVGTPFRADEEEAVGETAASERLADGSVAEVVQQGYRFFGGLLRPAKVVVARALLPPATAAAEPTPPDAESPP